MSRMGLNSLGSKDGRSCWCHEAALQPSPKHTGCALDIAAALYQKVGRTMVTTRHTQPASVVDCSRTGILERRA